MEKGVVEGTKVFKSKLTFQIQHEVFRQVNIKSLMAMFNNILSIIVFLFYQASKFYISTIQA